MCNLKAKLMCTKPKCDYCRGIVAVLQRMDTELEEIMFEANDPELISRLDTVSFYLNEVCGYILRGGAA